MKKQEITGYFKKNIKIAQKPTVKIVQNNKNKIGVDDKTFRC